ncbi:hypothetical protein [Maribacter aestuarii]|uniref:hypothetical protein n=1 Tax=Maribacter aestuarii TaxID=1130723 RepID=UPI00248AB75E|nr:hypothetical protein [Maribacter aestuarii]
MIRYIFTALCIVMMLSGCKKKRAPAPPEAVQLVFPERNSECTTGQSLGPTTSQVEFRWQLADNTDSYELRVTNTSTGTTQTITTISNTARLPIAKGEQFSWLVRSKNTEVAQTVSSEVWSFYNAGSRTTFVPFPAEIVSPRMSDNVFKDINNEVVLSWTGSDLDDDITSYEIYFSVETTPINLVGTVSSGSNSLKVSVASNTVYYWNVVTKDSEGNTSESGIYSFKVL